MEKLAVQEVEGQVQGRSDSSLQRIGSRVEIGTVLSATLETHAGDRFKVISDWRGHQQLISLNLVFFQTLSLPCCICACTHRHREGGNQTVGGGGGGQVLFAWIPAGPLSAKRVDAVHVGPGLILGGCPHFSVHFIFTPFNKSTDLSISKASHKDV